MKIKLDTDGRRSFLRLAAGFGAVSTGAALLAACGGGGDGGDATAAGRASALNLGGDVCRSLSARIKDSGGKVIGYVDVYNDAVNLYVTLFSETNCALLGQLSLWVGTNPAALPANSADYPWQKSLASGAGQYQFVIPLAGLGVSSTDASCASTPPTVYVFGQIGTDCGTGTIVGENSPTASRTLCCFAPPPPPVVLTGCETAFAKGTHVFVTDAKANPEPLPSLNLTRNRWGWAIHVTGTGTFTYDIYAGAGLNKVSDGKRVGTLTVVYNGSTASVTYAMAAGAAISEAHLYAGDAAPTTIAPGQYGNTASFTTPATSHTFNVAVSDRNGDGKIWLVAHAVVCSAST
jgi:hypothetical protein